MVQWAKVGLLKAYMLGQWVRVGLCSGIRMRLWCFYSLNIEKLSSVWSFELQNIGSRGLTSALCSRILAFLIPFSENGLLFAFSLARDWRLRFNIWSFMSIFFSCAGQMKIQLPSEHVLLSKWRSLFCFSQESCACVRIQLKLASCFFFMTAQTVVALQFTSKTTLTHTGKKILNLHLQSWDESAA